MCFLKSIILVSALLVGLHKGKTIPVTEFIQENGTNETTGHSKIIGKDFDREDYVLMIRIERPYTAFSPNKQRPMHPVRIMVGESTCIYEKYTYFFTEARNRNISPFDLLMTATVTIQNEDYYFYDAEDLCISVDDELNVDVWQFDCTPAGICICGTYFGYVDVGILPKIESHQIKYRQINGLDRKLVVEDGECRSGLTGHCSIMKSNMSLKDPLMCSNLYDCILDDSYGPILENVETKQVYGICLPKQESNKERSLSIIKDKTNNGTINNVLSFYNFMMIFMTGFTTVVASLV